VTGIQFDVAGKALTISIDFVAGSRFAVPGVEGEHPVHDTKLQSNHRDTKKMTEILIRQTGVLTAY
jgi:hypothetical protein